MSILGAILTFVGSVLVAGAAVGWFFAVLYAFLEWRERRQHDDTGAGGMTEEDMQRIKEAGLR